MEQTPGAKLQLVHSDQSYTATFTGIGFNFVTVAGTMSMNALSRREEENLVKTTKARALKECDTLVKDFAECATGRTVSVAWACRGQYKMLQECMRQYTSPEAMEIVRAEYLRLRDSPN